RAAAGSFAVRRDAPARELHQTLHDVESESRAVIAPACTRLEPGELLEQAPLVRRLESDAAIEDGELDLRAHTARGDGDLPAAHRNHRIERILDEIADHHVDRERIGEHLQVLRNARPELDLLLACALLE